MTAGAHGLRLVESSGTNQRRIFFWAMVTAIAVVMVVATWLMLSLAYEHGGINLRRWFFLLESDGVVKLVEKGGTAERPRKASRYKYLGN